MGLAAALVLRDRTNADPHQVLALALDELVASGSWATGRARRRLRRVTTLAPAGDAGPPPDLAEPLRALDAWLRAAAADQGAPLSLPAAATWVAVHRRAAVDGLARRTIDDLLARGLLVRAGTRLTPAAAGERALAAAPPPLALHVSARDDATRAAALRALSPLARAFLEAYRNTRAAPYGGVPGSVNGDNRQSAVRYGPGA